MENDLSLEFREAGTSESQTPPTDEPKQDVSFITPTKKQEFARPDSNFTPRRSPRAPKPKLFPDHCSPGFRRTPGSERGSPGTAPTTSTPPKLSSSTPFTAEAEVDTPASPNLEAIGSNDSFVIPTSICRVLQMSPRGTPNKAEPSGSGSGGTKNPPKIRGDALNKSGPSPYKSHRPKYLPKNINLVKKKRLERNEFLKKVEQFDAQLVKLPSVIVSPKRVVNPVAAGDEDLMGTQPHLAVIFHPEKYFASYDEVSFFDTISDMNADKLVHLVTSAPHVMSSKDLRILSLFLTVTSDKPFFDKGFLIVEEHFHRVKYALAWKDLKGILINFGLTKDFFIFDAAAYRRIDPPKAPKLWNFKFLFWLVERSLPSWPRSRLLRLVKFLSDCLFDPVLQKCQHDVVVLLRRVAKHTLKQGSSVEELVVPLNHSHFSMVCNRSIVQFLAPEVPLRPLAHALACRSVCSLLMLDKYESAVETNTFSHIADLLSDVQRVRENTGVKDVYQLVAICEVLVAMVPRPFDVETKTFLEKLADFVEHMSLTYSHFENLYFTDTVTRLRTLSTMNTF